MTKLYELTEKYRDIAKLLEYDYAEDLNIKGTLDDIQEEFNNKAINVAKIVLENRADQEAIKTEIERLKKRLNSLELNEKWLKDYLKTEMLAINTDSIKGDVVSIRVQKIKPSVEIIDENIIPKQFIKIIPEEHRPMKTEIYNHFNNTGEIVAGVNIITDKKTVVIR